MNASRRKETLTAQLVKALAGKIAKGEMRPGDRLPTEQALIETFSVSRTVVREAISSLKATGVVTTQQGVGAFICRPQEAPWRATAASLDMVQDAIDVLEVRMGVEIEAAALAAQRRAPHHVAAMQDAVARMARAIDAEDDTVAPDLDLHRTIAEATGNPHFAHLFSSLGALLIPRTRLETFRFTRDGHDNYLRRVNREHETIVQAIERRDVDSACSAMRMHLSNSRERLRKAL